MSTPSSEEPQKSKKPSNSNFKQQRLKAWQPILTAGTVLPMFFGVGIAFIPIGIGLLISSNMVQEFVYDYTSCTNEKNEVCAEVIKQLNPPVCTCTIRFNLTETFKGDVYMYYGLSNFYQNHRRYVKSRDDNQLLGHLDSKMSECDPFAYAEPATLSDSKGEPIAPCGAIANSLFNDSLNLNYVMPNLSVTPVPVIDTGIAWPTDKNVKFRNPQGPDLETAFSGFTHPINWKKNVTQLDPDDPSNNGFQNEDLIVWMRTAALPTFRKLYRRVDHSQTMFKNQLPSGIYELTITYQYPVTQFQGTKKMILSTTSWLGGKNPFLGIAYIVVGCICLVLGFVFLVIHIKFGKRSDDMVNITPQTAF